MIENDDQEFNVMSQFKYLENGFKTDIIEWYKQLQLSENYEPSGKTRI